ncbi:hypothetical protein LguiA_034514 [Lonicera macranthoides]
MPWEENLCQLVTYDLPYLAFHLTQKLLIYKGDDFEVMVEKLKDGISVVSEEFYQLAGRIGKDDEGVFRVEYDDCMSSVEVAVVATMEDVEVAGLTKEPSTAKLNEFVPYNGILNLEAFN